MSKRTRPRTGAEAKRRRARIARRLARQAWHMALCRWRRGFAERYEDALAVRRRWLRPPDGLALAQRAFGIPPGTDDITVARDVRDNGRPPTVTTTSSPTGVTADFDLGSPPRSGAPGTGPGNTRR